LIRHRGVSIDERAEAQSPIRDNYLELLDAFINTANSLSSFTPEVKINNRTLEEEINLYKKGGVYESFDDPIGRYMSFAVSLDADPIEPNSRLSADCRIYKNQSLGNYLGLKILLNYGKLENTIYRFFDDTANHINFPLIIEDRNKHSIKTNL
jgi:hypothetical protein